MAHPINAGHPVQGQQNLGLGVLSGLDLVVRKIQIVILAAFACITASYVASYFQIQGTALTVLSAAGWTIIGALAVGALFAPIISQLAIRNACAR